MLFGHAAENSAVGSRASASAASAARPSSRATTCRGRLPKEAANRIAESLRAELKRRYKRDYMRRWRSDPRNAAQEAEARRQGYYDRKCRRALAQEAEETRSAAEPACGICGRKPPVCEIERLVILADKNGSFVPVRIPYCGIC
jgi:hypothetical protein